jgi:hypothetical protein
VLLNRDTAEGIANGSITVVLRRWDTPRTKPGGTQRTVAGTIRIDAGDPYDGIAPVDGGSHLSRAPHLDAE